METLQKNIDNREHHWDGRQQCRFAFEKYDMTRQGSEKDDSDARCSYLIQDRTSIMSNA
jgi:hypothetical protein